MFEREEREVNRARINRFKSSRRLQKINLDKIFIFKKTVGSGIKF